MPPESKTEEGTASRDSAESVEPPVLASGARGGDRSRLRRGLQVLLASAIGTLLGIGAYTFRYAEGFSYFSTRPEACANCHIMRSQYGSWQAASHHTVAVCVDCHLPHGGLRKWLAKAENGYRHSKEFTAQDFAEPIVVKPRGRAILQENCLRCHGALVAELNPGPHRSKNSRAGADDVACVHCHAGVGHGETARLGGPLRGEERTTRNSP